MVAEITTEREELERRYRVTGERLDEAGQAVQRAEETIARVRRAANAVNARIRDLRVVIERDVAGLDTAAIETGTVNVKGIRAVSRFREELALLLEMNDRLILQHSWLARLEQLEAGISEKLALSARYDAKADLQQLDRDEVLKQLGEVEGAASVDGDVGLTAELRRAAASYAMAATSEQRQAHELRETLRRKGFLHAGQ